MDNTRLNAPLSRAESNRSLDDIRRLARQRRETVMVAKSDYEDLCEVLGQFRKLKDFLLGRGMSLREFNSLIRGDQTSAGPVNADHQRSDAAALTPIGHRLVDMLRQYQSANGHRGIVTSSNDADNDGFYLRGAANNADVPSGSSSVVPLGQRTISLNNLPDSVSFEQIIASICGGTVLCIYHHGREHRVNISFVEEDAAQKFLDYAKNNGIYIAGKQVEPSWNKRQFYVPPWVLHKINRGATRNIVINDVKRNITEARIREDMAHIHNLAILSVRFAQGNVYISTNSVYNAISARSCMLSRLPYKGLKIFFFDDECDQPLPTTVPPVPLGWASTKNNVKKVLVRNRDPNYNRFAPLSLDGAENERSENDGLNVVL